MLYSYAISYRAVCDTEMGKSVKSFICNCRSQNITKGSGSAYLPILILIAISQRGYQHKPGQ